MDAVRKMPVRIPADLRASAQPASGAGVTETVESGLRLVIGQKACARVRQLRGGVRFSRTAAELKIDRVASPTG